MRISFPAQWNLARKTTAAVAGIFLVFFLGSALALVGIISDALERQSRSNAELITEAIAGISAFHIFNYSYYSLDEVTRNLLVRQNGEQFILGVLVYDNEGNVLNPSGLDFRKELAGMDKNDFMVSSGTAVYTQGILRETVGSVEIYFSRIPLRSQILRIEILLGIFALAASALLLTLTSLFTRRAILDPLNQLRAASASVTRGNFTVMLDVERRDELGDLARDIVDMARTLEKQISQIQETNTGLEEKVRLRTSELVRAERMAAVTNLVFGMAHEINTPVGNILLAASLQRDRISDVRSRLEKAGGNDASQIINSHLDGLESSLSIILDSTDRAAKLIGSLRSFRGLNITEERVEFNITEHSEVMIRALLSDFDAEAVTINISAEDTISIRGYPGFYTQLFSVLISNALTHSGLPPDKISISVSLSTSRKLLHIGFSNNGLLIEESIIEHIYEPFFTTERGRGHTGLGLYILYNIIVNDLKGTIRHENISGGVQCLIEIPDVAPAEGVRQ